MNKIVLLATLAAAALAGDSHTKRQVLLPAYGVYPGFGGGLGVPAFPAFSISSFPYVTYHVSAPTILAPSVATATVTTTIAPVPADTIKVEPIAPIAPVAPVAVAAPAVAVGCPGVNQEGASLGCPGRNPNPSAAKTKISVIQTDD